MIATISVSKHGPFFSQSSLFPGKLQLAAQAIANVVEEKAKEDYMNKRKTDKVPSLIFSSINYDIKESNALVVHAVVFAGGPSNIEPYYTVFVNDGHGYKNGTEFSGYHFMQAGAKVGEEQKMVIVNRILKSK